MDRVIAEVTAEYANFTLEDAGDEPAAAYTNECEYARDFAQFAVELLQEYVEANPDPVRLAQAKVRLLDRYFEWRAQGPKNHRHRVSENGHTCIFHVFERTYQRIRMVELKLVPPKIVIEVPVKPPPPALPQVQGIYLGEVIGEEN